MSSNPLVAHSSPSVAHSSPSVAHSRSSIVHSRSSTALSGTPESLSQPTAPRSKPSFLSIGDKDHYPLGRVLEYLEDREGRLTFDDVRSSPHTLRFTQSETDIPNFGHTASVYWIRIRLDNSGGRNAQWILALQFSNLHDIEFYRPRLLQNTFPTDINQAYDNQAYDILKTGARHPFSTRERPYHHFAFNVSLPPGAQQTLYLRLQNEASMTLPMSLWSSEGFVRHSRHQLFFSGLFYGGLLFLIAYNTFLWMTLRDHTYGWYVGLMASILAAQMVYEGFAAQYLWPEQPWLNQFMMLFFWSVLSIFMQMLTLTFLETRSRAPRCHRIIIGLLILWSLIICLIPFLDYRIIIRWTMVLRMVNILFFIGVNLVIWRQGYLPVRYFLTAWISLALSIILIAMTRMGWLPSVVVWEHGYKIGTILAGLLFSFALTDRIRVLQNEKEIAQQNLLMARMSDRAKTRFISTMGHELRTPLTAVLGYAQLLKQKITPDSTEFKGLECIEGSGRHLLNLIEVLLDLSRIENGTLELIQKPFSLVASLDTLAHMIRLQAIQKGVIFEYHLHPDLPDRVLGDETRLGQVLINLLGNAVKFTGQKGHVILNVAVTEDSRYAVIKRSLHFSIKDSGPGIPEEQLETVFTPFVQLKQGVSGKEGVGLGLTITRELIRLMGTELEVESVVGVGSTFSFTLALPEIVSIEKRLRQKETTEDGPIRKPLAGVLPRSEIDGDRPLPVLLPTEALEHLRLLANNRAFTQLETALSLLKAQEDRYVPLIDELLQLLEQFQFQAIIERLNEG